MKLSTVDCRLSTIIVYFLILNLIGCEAFVRKFTRKPKKDKYKQEEPVIEPEVYKPTMSKAEQYRQYLLFWKSWQDELITALITTNPNHKKQVSCANEAIKNLMGMRKLLNELTQNKLDIYINRMSDLRDKIVRDSYSSNINSNRQAAERLRRDILQNFSFNDIKNSFV
ncbi:MAG: hypothetical protein WC658_01720 [Candidatus Omnitrophota bacterium]